MNDAKFTIEQLITFAEGERDQCLEYEAEYPNAPDPESGIYDATATTLRMNAEMYAMLDKILDGIGSDCRVTIDEPDVKAIIDILSKARGEQP